MADTFSEVKELLVDLLGADESRITPDSRFREDLEADSLDLVELIMALEDKFGAEISDEDAQKITTVGEAVRYIDRHTGRVTVNDVSRFYSPPKQMKPISGAPDKQQANSGTGKLVQRMHSSVIQKLATSNTVFVSYSRSDWNTYVKPLIDNLHTQMISVWVDQYLIEGGQDWQDEINRALDVCDRMILCVTPRSLSSKFVKMEYRYFFNHNKLLIPVLCEEAGLPAELQGIQHTSYKDLNRLLSLLRR